MSVAFTRKPSSKDTLTRRHSGAKQTPVPKITTIPVSPTGYTFLQPKLLCPCDGGCPSCAPLIQPKLKVGQPNDKYEQEADRVAEQIMRMSEPACPECKEEEEELIQTKPLAEQITPLVQRQVELENEELIQAQLVDGTQLQRQEEPEEEEEAEEEEIIQPKGGLSQIPELISDLESRIKSLKSGGQPLPKSVRAFFEPRFGHDFTQVRVHTDTLGAKSARAVNAKAYTLGRDIVFGAGQYAPKTTVGKELLAHELTHVVQQNHENRGNGWFCSLQTPILQLARIPARPFEGLFRPSPTPSPPSSPPATTPSVQFTVPVSIQQAVNSAFQTVAGNPRSYESDFMDILLAPEYDRVRITLNFLIHRFPGVYRLLDGDLRTAIRSQIPDPATQEEVFNRVISNIANMLFLDLARQWDQTNPGFHRRLEQERRRREQRPPVRIPPGAVVV